MLRQVRETIGASPPDRKAADRLCGAGCYVADVALDAPLPVAFLRSPVPLGRLGQFEAEAALALPGVIAVHTSGDVAHLGRLAVNPVLPILRDTPFPILGGPDIQHMGQAIAAVLATDAQAALDGVEALEFDLEEIDPNHAAPVAARSWTGGNSAIAFAEAAHCVEVTLQHPRLAPSPLETRGIAVSYAADGLTLWHSTQTPHRTRSALAEVLDIAPTRLRVIAPDVGGAFGMKGSIYPEEVFAVWAAMQHGRDVRWISGRSEDFLSAAHGRGIRSWGRLAVDDAGRFVALEAEVTAPVGPWLPNSALVPAWNAARILPGGYTIPNFEISCEAISDPRGPVGIYRGAGRPEAACLMERLVAKAAAITGIDAMELRRRNVHAAQAFPVRTGTGNLLDSGNYAAAIEMAVSVSGYDDLLGKQARRRAEGALFGIGTAFYLEPSGEGFETATVTWAENGRVTVASGSSSQGQGRETAYAQIAAELLDVSPEDVVVRQGDTGTCPEGIGAVASRGTAIGGSAVMVACERLRARRLRGHGLPMSEAVRYENEGQAWGYGIYVVAVEVDRDTGTVRFDQVTCLDDAGRMINPAFVEGQVRGGFAQGLGEALLESVHYDGDGQLLTGSLMDYALPRAVDMPGLDIHKTEHPSPMNAIGAKGVGEAGTIGAPAAILNAVMDALAPEGVEDLDMPLTTCKIWTALKEAQCNTAD